MNHTALAWAIVAANPALHPAVGAASCDPAGSRAKAVGEAPPAFTLRHLGTHSTGRFDQGASEVAAYHAPSRRLWVVNGAAGVDVIDVSDPAKPVRVATHAATAPTSVAIHGELAAIAEPGSGDSPGRILFRSVADGTALGEVTVGHGPDMCAFTPDGRTLLVANEGEPRGGSDAEGTVSVIDLRDGPSRATVRTAGFGAFETMRGELVAQGVHLPVPGAGIARQFEPEYVAASPDGKVAFVAVQEANALAVLDLATAAVTEVHGLGLKDFSTCGLDPCDTDGVRIRPEPVLGLRQPDTVVCWSDRGRVFVATSNEGEVREDKSTDELRKVSALKLDPRRFPDPSIAGDDRLGRLDASAPACDTDGDGLADRIVAFGGRGVTVWEWAPGSLRMVWDSGSDIERVVAAGKSGHNNDGRRFRSDDRRSASKGPEPEGLATMVVDGRRILAVGLERPGGVVLWDATDPSAPVLMGHFNRFDPSVDPAKDPAKAGDIAPEGVLAIDAAAAPGGVPVIVTCNEVSGTTSLWAVEPAASK